MPWDDEPTYQRYEKKKSNVVDISSRQNIKWSHEVMNDKNRQPRESQESPLKQWWLQQQAQKESENLIKND